MATFNFDNDYERLDWQLLRDGPITMFRTCAVLNSQLDWLRRHAYAVTDLDCTGWECSADFHTAIAAALDFPTHYGKNLDAFSDCLSYINIPEEGGKVLVLRRIDHFAATSPKLAQAVLDICADKSRFHLLLGRRLVILLQSDNPALSFSPVGATTVQIAYEEQPDF